MTTEEAGPRTALEHLQRAAIEVIAAARATLDTLDAVVADPPRPEDILGRVGPLADAFWDWLGTVAGSAPDGKGPTPGHPNGTSGPGRGRKPVEHIPVR